MSADSAVTASPGARSPPEREGEKNAAPRAGRKEVSSRRRGAWSGGEGGLKRGEGGGEWARPDPDSEVGAESPAKGPPAITKQRRPRRRQPQRSGKARQSRTLSRVVRTTKGSCAGIRHTSPEISSARSKLKSSCASFPSSSWPRSISSGPCGTQKDGCCKSGEPVPGRLLHTFYRALGIIAFDGQGLTREGRGDSRRRNVDPQRVPAQEPTE